MFQIYIDSTKRVQEIPGLDSFASYDPRDFDETCSVIDLCSILSAANIMKFIVKGFDQPAGWQLDISYDLSMILEDLPKILSLIESDSYPVRLDFYGQGVERHIVFEDKNKDTMLTAICLDLKRKPFREAGREVVEKDDLERQLRKLKDDFIHVVTTAFPKRTNSEFFRSWCNSFKV